MRRRIRRLILFPAQTCAISISAPKMSARLEISFMRVSPSGNKEGDRDGEADLGVCGL